MSERNAGIIRKDNASILNAIRNGASLNYQQRIPSATQANISETLSALQSYSPLWNEFCDALINRIGSVIVRNMIWNNPLAEFKEGMLNFGDTIEEISVGLIQSKTYSPLRDYLEKELFGSHPIEVKSIFHTINRQEYYPITVKEDLLRRAFLEENGLSQFVSSLMAAPATSDAFDEFLLMVGLFREYNNLHGFHNVKVPDLNTLSASESDSRQFLKVVQALAETLKFPSREYNAANMPSFASNEELVLFTTPEVRANLNVEGLAVLFNVNHADINTRIITVPKEHFGIKNGQAILTTKGFFKVVDQKIETTSQINPVALSTNYFLHHWGTISASLFVPAILLNSEKNDEVIKIQPSNVVIGELAIKVPNTETVPDSVTPGSNYEITAPLMGDNLEGFEIGVDYDVSGHKSQRTMISNDGVLSVGADETGTTLTVTATVTYRPIANPDASPSTKTKTLTVEVGKAQALWPGKRD